ncbi:MAG: TerC/Alx family metal homeostasis membrane protein [Anaerovoracaceae bacterium]|jgi:tellurite resistance protein TerC|nr:TerC/Alx family metal homeostasis membrane protein [Anaerovoracaceae bacterium]
MKDNNELMKNNNKEHKLANAIKSVKWLLFWIALAMLFCAGIYFKLGKAPAIDFLGGYLIEFSLSIDNVFVFLMIFMSFGISEHAQHRVLGWGILSAIVLRFFFIFFGVSVVNKFEWVLYIFGVLLLFSGAKMFRKDEEEKDPHDSRILRAMGKVIPMSTYFDDDNFFTKENGKRLATPLLGVLVLIESSDIMFAIDSVPAVLSVSRDLFIVYTSNIFAILGLRQLFFVIEHMQERFAYVRYGVAVILIFTGLKMVAGIIDLHISTPVSIAVIIGTLVISIAASMIVSKKKA